MPKLMKPITFGCEQGFKEFFYDADEPTNEAKQETGMVYCYKSMLTDSDKKNSEAIGKCLGMKPDQCWKK